MSEARKKMRCTALQKEKLIAAMMANKELALGTASCPMSQQKLNQDWAKLAEELSELGPNKTVDQWKTTWRDIKSKAKTINASVHRSFRQTGNSVTVPVLSENDHKVISIIGNTSSIGISDVPESIVVDIPPEVAADASPVPSTSYEVPSHPHPELPQTAKKRKIDLGEAYITSQSETVSVLKTAGGESIKHYNRGNS